MNGRNTRIGQGVDVHAFCAGDHVMLCGVRIPHERGVAAHSDGDVALHALCDALLGAAALGDIGAHFPDDDPVHAGADSRVLTKKVLGLLDAAGWRINNIDLTIVCESPRIGPHIAAMRDILSRDLGVTVDAVSVKATTTERLGFCGRGEGIVALAVATLAGD